MAYKLIEITRRKTILVIFNQNDKLKTNYLFWEIIVDLKILSNSTLVRNAMFES
jgi:hypothetical protein